MKSIILLAFVGLAMSATVPLPDSTVEILQSTNDINPDGSYHWSFETADGYTREETGTVVNPGQEDFYIAVVGSYKYTDDAGKVVNVQYTADKDGFVPIGSPIFEIMSNNARALSQVSPPTSHKTGNVASRVDIFRSLVG